MSDQRKCPQCGALLPAGALQGLCPACLLKEGASTETGAPAPQAFDTPSVDQIARLFPQLEVLELIGKGGMGAIYKARQRSLDRWVALKILPSRQAGGEAFAERFNREAKALARLNHPNIVAVYEFGQVDGLHYFLMEYVDGVNLRQLLQAERLSPRQDMEIIPQICDALQYAHDAGVVHRDIKPENVLVDRKGRVKIADFGLAKLVSAEPRDMRLTLEGQVMGTPHYMAPEQVEHPLEVDHRADIYALGVVFYEMLTGELPLGKFAPPSRKVEVDLRLDEVVLRALEKEPERRYQQASQVKTDVEGIAHAPEPAASGTSGRAGAAEATVNARAQSGSAGGPSAWWRFKNRLWPPVVCRRGNERFINWPAVGVRGLRVLLVGLSVAVVLGVAFGNLYGVRRGIAMGLLEMALAYGTASIILTIRVLRGLAGPVNLLPDIDAPPVWSGKDPDDHRVRRAGTAGVAVFFLVFTLAAVLTNLLERTYVGITRLEVRKSQPGDLAFDPYFVQTEMEKIRSVDVAKSVVERFDLLRVWGPRIGAITEAQCAQVLQDRLEVRQAPNTSLLEIRFYSEDTHEAAQIANGVAHAFQDRNRGTVSIVDEAESNWKPIRPNVPLNLFLGAFGGVVLGSITAAAVYLFARRRSETCQNAVPVTVPLG